MLPHNSAVPVVCDSHNVSGAVTSMLVWVSELVCIRRAPGGFGVVVCFWVVAKVDEESVFAAQWHSVVDCGCRLAGVGDVVTYGKVDGFSGTDGHGEVINDVEVLSDFVGFGAVGVGELEFAGEGAGFNEVVRAGEVKLVEKIGVEDTLTKCVGVCEFDTQVLGELVIKADGACCRDMEGRVVNPAVCFDQRWEPVCYGGRVVGAVIVECGFEVADGGKPVEGAVYVVGVGGVVGVELGESVVYVQAIRAFNVAGVEHGFVGRIGGCGELINKLFKHFIP